MTTAKHSYNCVTALCPEQYTFPVLCHLIQSVNIKSDSFGTFCSLNQADKYRYFSSNLKKMTTSATFEQLRAALDHVNTLYEGNICWNREPERISKNKIAFTLRVIDSSKPGARRSASGRRLVSACYHVHGHLFDYLLNNGVRVIQSAGQTIRSHSDNWSDWNAGSMMYPAYMSELCEC